jgi:hypothetical protein
MVDGQNQNNGVNYSTKNLIIEAIKNHNPKNGEELVSIVQERTSLSSAEIVNLFEDLENDGILHFLRQENHHILSTKDNFFSKKNMSFFFTIFIAIAAAVSVLIPSNAYPFALFRNIFGFILVLFLPGYSFAGAFTSKSLFSKRGHEKKDFVELIGVSVGVSICLASLVALVLNYSPWGMGFLPMTVGLLILTIAFSVLMVARKYSSLDKHLTPS